MRINAQINLQRNPNSKPVREVLVVSDNGPPEKMHLDDAIRKAELAGLDLVEVSPNQDVPVCRIVDFGKWKFQQQKKEKKQRPPQIKEVKMRPKIAEHDYQLKKNQAMTFLQRGDRVKVSLTFRGREMAHQDIGMAIVKRMVEDVKNGVVDSQPKLEGKQIVMMLRPKK